jgi:hypothetical protein
MKPFIVSTAVLLFELWQVVQNTITPKAGGFGSSVVGPHDTTTYLMRNAFNIQPSANPVFTTTFPQAQIISYKAPYKTHDISAIGINSVQQIIDLGEGIFGLIYNMKSFLIFPVSKDGKHFGTPVNFTDPTFGANVVCDDMTLNLLNSIPRVYVSCHNSDSSSQTPYSSLIYEINLETGALLNKVIITQDSSHYLGVFATTKIVTLLQGSTQLPLLIFYGRGLSGSTGTNNLWFRYCTGVASGNLNCPQGNLIDFQITNLNYKAFYDIYQYGNELIISGLPGSGVSHMSLSACTLSVSSNQMLCRETIQQSNTGSGWIGLVGDNRYAEIDFDASTATVCNLVEDFASPNFLKSCPYKESIQIYSNAFARDVEFDNSALIVEFVHPDYTYIGYSVHVFFSNLNSLHNDTIGTLCEDKLITLDPKQNYLLGITWLISDMLIITGANPGTYVVTVSAKDDTTPVPVSATLSLLVQSTYLGIVNANPSFNWPLLDLMQGSYYRWPIEAGDFTGNALTYDVEFDPITENFFELHIFKTSRTDISFRSDDPNNRQLVQVLVGDKFAIGLDAKNNLVFFTCKYPGLVHFVCQAIQVIPQQAGTKLYSKTGSISGIAYCYTISGAGTTTVYLFDGEDVSSKVFQGVSVQDLTAFRGKDKSNRSVGMIAVAINNFNTKLVEVFTFDLGSIYSITSTYTITATNTQDGYFCPQQMDGYNNQLLVTSVCSSEGLSDQRVITYTFPGPIPMLENPLPSGAHFVSPKACLFGNAMVLSGFNTVQNSTVLYMTSSFDEDPAEEFFGLTEYGINTTQPVTVNCMPEHNLFSVAGQNPDKMVNVAIFYGNSRGQANQRCHSVIVNATQSAQPIGAFSFGHGGLHVVYDLSGSPFFYTSFINGPFIYTDISTQANQALPTADSGLQGTVTVSAYNFGMDRSADMMTSFNLRAVDQTISLNVKSQINGLSVGNFDLENSLTVSGPVFDAYVTDGYSKYLTLTPRAEFLGSYKRESGVTYNSIKVSGLRTYAGSFQADYSTVDYFYNGNYSKTFSGLGGGRFACIEVLNIASDTDILFYIAPDNGQNSLFGMVYQNGIRKYTKISAGATKGFNLESITITATKAMLFAQTRSDLDVYIVDFTNPSNVTITPVRTVNINNVLDFGLSSSGNTVYVTAFGNEDNVLQQYQIGLSSENELEHQGVRTIQLKAGGIGYRLTKVHCANWNATHYSCLINTESSFLGELYINYTSGLATTYYLDKFGYLEGYEVEMAGNYLFMYGRTQKPGVTTMGVLAWKRQLTGGSGKLWYGVHLPVPSDQLVDITYQAPFAVWADPNSSTGECFLASGTLFAGNPIYFHHISTFKLNVLNATFDPTQVSLVFQGLTYSDMSVSSIFFSSGNTVKPVFFFVLLGVMALLAIVWVAYTNIKSANEREETGTGHDSAKYVSVSNPTDIKEDDGGKNTFKEESL